MMSLRALRPALIAAALLLPALASAFPFYLADPKRSNPGDPKSAQYVAPAPTVPIAPFNTATPTWTYTSVVATNTAVVPTDTFTTAPNTNTFTHTHTFTITNTPGGPTSTFTHTPTHTPSYTNTNTFTHTYTATPTYTPTQTYTVGGPTDTPTPTLTPAVTHGAVVADFESVGTNDRTLWNDGPVLTIRDSVGSTLNPYPFGPASATAGGAFGASSYSGCITGTMVMQDAGNSIYPYCLIAFELVPSGTAPPPTGVDVDLTAYSPNNGLKFDYKAGAAGVQYRVKLATTNITDFGYHEYIFTSVDTAWHTLEIWFPGTPSAPRVFAQPGWAAVVAFDKTKVGGILFEPVQSTTAAVVYDLCIDNLGFDASDASLAPTNTPTPTPVVTHGSLVADMESVGTNDRTLWNGGPILSVADTVGSTYTQHPWGANSATAGGAYGASAYAACFDGNMVMQDGGASIYPYNLLAFELIPAGSAPPPTGVDVDLTAYSPNKGLKFDYKAGAAGVPYRVKLASTTVTDFGYYEYIFTPADTAWHTLEIWFPTETAATAKFAQPGWAATKAWDITKVGGILFEPVQSTTAAVPWNLCVDNLTFDVSAAPAPVATPTFGTGTYIADFEDNLNNNKTLAPFAQDVSTGSGSGGVINPFPWAADSGTAGGAGASAYAGCFDGSLPQQDPATNYYPYAVMELLLAPSGWSGGGGTVNVTPLAPSKRIIFDYKAAAAGVQYNIQLVTQDITAYNFYEYSFTPSNTNWNTLVVYFPDSPYTPKLAQSWGAPVAWSPNLAGEVIIRPVPQNSGPVTFGLCVDNLRFD